MTDSISNYNRLVTIFVAIGSLTYGYSSSIISSTIGQPGWFAYFNLPVEGEPGYESITTPAESTANGLFSAGGAVGCLFLMWSCDFFGRRANIQIGAFLAMFGGALQEGPILLLCSKLEDLSAVLELVSWLLFAPYYHPFLRMEIPAVPPELAAVNSAGRIAVAAPFPRWLIQKGKLDEAQDVLLKLRAPDELAAREEFLQTKEQIELEAQKLAEYGNIVKAIIKKPSYRKRMIIGFLTQWGAEFGGPLIINNYQVLLYTNLGETGGMPLLLSAVWLTTAGVIYNPLGAWLHDKVNSRRKMFMTGFAGIIVTTSVLAAMTALYAGTTNKAGNAVGILFMYLYLAMQGTFCDTTMYLYVSEIFPTEIRPIGMGFSLFGQFAATLILLETAPMGFNNVGWKYYLVIICWSAFFIPVIYFFWPETARLTLEEIAKNFGDEVAVNLTDATEEEKAQLDKRIIENGAGKELQA
ncbi:hypothetical protein N7468_005231 [Penicillium chermesinum]|uniref:Major facilitator superfamily (MFS) profile domain-containing protein n=1 Tax=Penicillium chermesinum TaxID=63820 RepID=A0A9W9NZF3_9EURO|nr:uncharacterized protein N7468_005231 [Penicillium chermesinum]KAJ5232275.1 hypothetical protein N7468_005231 [Penicillium chermesinum]